MFCQCIRLFLLCIIRYTVSYYLLFCCVLTLILLSDCPLFCNCITCCFVNALGFVLLCIIRYAASHYSLFCCILTIMLLSDCPLFCNSITLILLCIIHYAASYYPLFCFILLVILFLARYSVTAIYSMLRFKRYFLLNYLLFRNGITHYSASHNLWCCITLHAILLRFDHYFAPALSVFCDWLHYPAFALPVVLLL